MSTLVHTLPAVSGAGTAPAFIIGATARQPLQVPAVSGISCAGPSTAATFSSPSAGASVSAQAAALAVGTAVCAGLRRSRRGRTTAASGRAVQVRRQAGGAGPIETFLVQGDVNVANLAAACAPLANHFDLDGIVFFTLGVSPEIAASVAGGALGLHGVCPVYIADCYGVIGWDKTTKANVELMEEGRGSEYGCVGGKGGKGVVVAAFRGGHMPSELKLPDSCGLHMVVTASGKPEEKPASGSIYGGVAKACYKLEHSGNLVEVPNFAVSTPSGVVTSFAGEASEAAKAAVKAAASSPAVAGYFPCFCRGVNKYGEDNVEPAAFASNGMGEVPLFGMFAHGELGPPQGEPVQSSSESKASDVQMHSSTSVLALYPA